MVYKHLTRKNPGPGAYPIHGSAELRMVPGGVVQALEVGDLYIVGDYVGVDLVTHAVRLHENRRLAIRSVLAGKLAPDLQRCHAVIGIIGVQHIRAKGDNKSVSLDLMLRACVIPVILHPRIKSLTRFLIEAGASGIGTVARCSGSIWVMTAP